MRIETAEHVEAAHREDQFLRDGRPEIAFVGRSNVGKSSLLNRLLGRKGLARISSTPGRTRAVHFYLVNGRSYFVDLPGYGYAKVSKADRAGFAELVDRYFQRSRRPEERFVVVLLVDGKVGATPLDRQAREYFEANEVPHLVVATKVDKLPKSGRARALAGIRTALGLSAEEPAIAVSAETGEGIAELWKEIGGVLRS